VAEPKIDTSEWRAEIERLMQRAGDEGLTTKELARSLDMPRQKVREFLYELESQGRLVSGHRIEKSLDKSMRRRPVYRIKKAPKR